MGSAMYKVGDKVRVVHSDNRYSHIIPVGDVVSIINTFGDYMFDVDFEEYGQVVDIHDIELYTPKTFQVGETYTTASGHTNKCIHIENGIAWCVSARDDGTAYGPAYTWDMEGNYLNAPPSECAPYKITLGPTVERKTVIASVDYVDGKPDWETVGVVS